MKLSHLARLFLVGLSEMLAADGLALISGRDFHGARIAVTGLGAVVSIALTKGTLRRKFVAMMFGLGAIWGIGRAVLRIARYPDGAWEGAQGELWTLVICAFYMVLFLRLTTREKIQPDAMTSPARRPSSPAT